MYSGDFTADNLGAPDAYTVHSLCRQIRIREKDRNASPQATFNVYGLGLPSYRPMQGGEEFIFAPGLWMQPGVSPLSLETVNVGAAVFSVIEE